MCKISDLGECTPWDIVGPIAIVLILLIICSAYLIDLFSRPDEGDENEG